MACITQQNAFDAAATAKSRDQAYAEALERSADELSVDLGQVTLGCNGFSLTEHAKAVASAVMLDAPVALREAPHGLAEPLT